MAFPAPFGTQPRNPMGNTSLFGGTVQGQAFRAPIRSPFGPAPKITKQTTVPLTLPKEPTIGRRAFRSPVMKPVNIPKGGAARIPARLGRVGGGGALGGLHLGGLHQAMHVGSVPHAHGPGMGTIHTHAATAFHSPMASIHPGLGAFGPHLSPSPYGQPTGGGSPFGGEVRIGNISPTAYRGPVPLNR